MKSLFIALFIAVSCLCAVYAFAQGFANGNGYSNGLAGVSQYQIQNGGVNWTGALLTGSGVNWTDVRSYASKYGDHSGINWQSLGV